MSQSSAVSTHPLTETGPGPNEKGLPTAKNRGLFRRSGAASGSCRTVSKHCRNFAVRATHAEAGQFSDSGKLLMSLAYRRVTTRSDLGPLRAVVCFARWSALFEEKPLTARRAWGAIRVTGSNQLLPPRIRQFQPTCRNYDNLPTHQHELVSHLACTISYSSGFRLGGESGSPHRK